MEDKKQKNKLLKHNEISKDTGKNMKVRIFSALVLLVICLPCAFVGSYPFFILIGAIICFSIYEVIKVPKQKKLPVLLWVALFSITLAFIYWPFIKNCIAGGEEIYKGFVEENNINKMFEIGFANERGYGSLLMATPIIGIAFIVMFLTTISDETFTIRDVFYYFGMAIVLGLGFQSFYYLRYLPFAVEPNVYYDGGVYEYLASSMLFMYVVAGTMITDIGAYFFGVFFGKHKMNPRVSPKKTWEGFFGGIFVSVVFSIAYVFIADAAGCPILRGFLDIQHWYWVLLLSFAMPIIGNLGDLAFSAIKRDYNVKDYSNIIPGHGGVLDRIDSLLFTMPTVAILLMFITNGWQIIA
jgi:phosphatidate cytidylyltransferase